MLALFGGSVMSAQAADQAAPRGTTYSPGSYYPTSMDWTGWYAGLQVGGAFGSASWTNPFSGLNDDPKPSAILGGGQLGVNWMRNSFLLGAEADFTWMDLKGSANDANGNTHTVHSHWLSLVTGRLAYGVDRFLVYAKGGAAFGNERNKVVDTLGQLAVSSTTTQVGWTVGGGIEYAITPNWSARVEYDFVDLPSHGIVLVGPRAMGSVPANVDFTVQKIVGGINYRF